MKNLFLFLICGITLISSCKKESEAKNDGLIGKWQLVEMLDPFHSSTEWIDIPLEGSHTQEFKNDGSFIKREYSGGINAICTGQFESLPDNVIRVNSACNPPNELIKISYLSPSQLILDRQGFEGSIRFRYKAVQ